MSVLVVLVFASIVLVAGGLLLFAFAMKQRDFEHADRLSILPLVDPPSTVLAARPARAACPGEAHRTLAAGPDARGARLTSQS